jgi:TonB dependent receptor/TonB-dependent Receptor Plug Domain
MVALVGHDVMAKPMMAKPMMTARRLIRKWTTAVVALACFAPTPRPYAQGTSEMPSAPDMSVGAASDTSIAMADTVRIDTANATDLPTKTVKGRREALHEQSQLGKVRLNQQDILRTTATQGDPLRAVSTLPGVNTQNDLSVRPFIRGGKADETRVFLDGLNLIQPYHFGGAYSPFNPELVERLEVHRSFAPATQRDALSGSLAVKTREPKSVEAVGDLSLIRANAMVAAPLPGKVTLYGGWHTFFYDETFKTGLALLDVFVDDPGFEEYREDVNALVDLPSFRDFQAGFFWRPSDKVLVHGNSLFSADRFTHYQPAWRYTQGGREVSPTFYSWASIYDGRDLKKHKGQDTLSLVAVNNDVHFLRTEWRAAPRLKARAALAWQRQEWDVGFYDDKIWRDSIDGQNQYHGSYTREESDLLLKFDRSVLQMKAEGEWSLGENRVLTFGVERETWQDRYHTKVPRALFETLVNGNADLFEGLSYVAPKGLTITRSDLPKQNGPVEPFDVVSTLRFDYQGRREPAFGAIYLSDRWDATANLRLETGLRLEHAETPNHWFTSPRFSMHQKLTDRDELAVGVGLYAQSDLPFYALDANPNLKPEKVWQGAWSLTHDFGNSIQIQIEHWYKWYEDLVALKVEAQPGLDYRVASIDSEAFADLPADEQALMRTLYGERSFSYSNEGRGEAQGMELSVSYRPNALWTGWFSGEQSVSRRQESRGEPWSNYRYHRPWALNWVNWWHFPGDYALGTRLRYAAGQPYTPYHQQFSVSDFDQNIDYDQDTLFALGARNSARYAPYMRFDLRISRDTRLFGHPLETYFEVWNAFNQPNFILRDGKTGKFKFWELNYPIPVLFFGARWRY